MTLQRAPVQMSRMRYINTSQQRRNRLNVITTLHYKHLNEKKKQYTEKKKILQEKNNVSCRFWLSDMNCVHCSEFVLYDDCGGDLEKKKWEKAGMCIGWVHTHPLKGFRAITHSLRFWRLIEGRRKASCWMLRQVWKARQSWPNSPLSISLQNLTQSLYYTVNCCFISYI